MDHFLYCADFLPEITLCGKQAADAPFCNIRRISGDYIFYFVTEGDVYIREDGVDYHLKKGDCFLLEPGKLHMGIQASYYKLFYIHFKHPDVKKETVDPEALTQRVCADRDSWRSCPKNGPFPDRYISVCKRFSVENKAKFLYICGMMEELIACASRQLEYYPYLCACSANKIFIELWRCFVDAKYSGVNGYFPATERIDMVIAYLNANYRRRLNSAVIERELSYNFDYLNQIFRKFYHTSLFRVLEDIRIREAKYLLKTSTFSVMQIANEVGYADAVYFSKVFKRHTGITPGKFRKNPETQI